MAKITILFSACSSPTAPGTVNCFKNNGERDVRIVGVDMDNDPTVLEYVDAFYNVLSATDINYCDQILEICRKEKVDIYFPNISAEVSAIVARKKEFDDLGVILSVSNQQSVEISNNKYKTYQLLKENGVPVPNFYSVKSLKDFEEGCSIMGYPEKPVVIKIVDGSGSRGVRIIDAKRSRYDIFVKEKPNSFFTSYSDMYNILKERDELDEMMLVDFMPGNEYTVDMLAENGKVLYGVGRENTVSLMSIAQESILKEDKEAYDISEKVVSLLNYTGNIGIDFMRDVDGRPVLMDINPRLTATMSIARAGGVNLPYLRIKQLLGESMPKLTPVYGTRLKRRYAEYFAKSNGELFTDFK